MWCVFNKTNASIWLFVKSVQTVSFTLLHSFNFKHPIIDLYYGGVVCVVYTIFYFKSG